jgi:ferritin-like protein
MAHSMKIVELMTVPAEEHDLDWLRESLQAAIELEFATIPPYLSAFWSVKNRIDPVARSIREIVREEMLHMGLACNMLTAIGGTPALNTPGSVPVYPGPLPGGVHPELRVSLQGLSRAAARLFMDIEFPENGPVALEATEAFPTIGAFYTAVLDAFETLQPPLSEDRQLEGPLGLGKVRSLEEVLQAIELIKRQGEGSQDSPEDTGVTDLAHYYRFGEIYHGRKLRKEPETGEWGFNGDPMPFPDVWPMAEVPPGGYQDADVTEQVRALLHELDRIYTTMLNQLQDAWQNGSQDSLDESIGSMFSLRDPAVSLMQIPIPSGTGTYGPCFRLAVAE